MSDKELLNKYMIDSEHLQRELKFDQSSIDVEKRTVEVVITTSDVVDRGDYFEQINLDGVDMSRVDNGVLPLLENHNRRERQLGRVISARIEGTALLGTILFSRSQKADELFQDIIDGVIQAFSIGMSVDDVKILDEAADKPTFIFTGEFQELSAVGIPADMKAKVIGRSIEEDTPTTTIIEKTKMTTENKEVKAPAVDLPEIERKAKAKYDADAKVERNRVSQITKLAEKYDVEGAGEAIEKGVTVEEFQHRALEKMVARGEAKKASISEVELSKKEKADYSLSRAVLASGGHLDMKKAGLEIEVSRALESSGHASSGDGILIPADMFRHQDNPLMLDRAAQSVGTAGNGGNLVADNFRADLFVDALYNSSAALGRISVMSGLVGNLVIPTQTGGHAGYWVAEDGTPTQSNATFGQLALSPKVLGANSRMTLNALRQTTPAIDALVRQSLAEAMAQALDKGVFEGAGTDEPVGLIDASRSLQSVSVTNSPTPDLMTPTWAELVAFEQLIAEGNYPLAGCEFTVSPALVTYLKTTLKDAAVAGYLMSNGEVNGYPVHSTTNMTVAQSILFGNMKEVIMGQWGQAIEVVTTRSSANGSLDIGVFTMADVEVRRNAAFAVAVDA